MQVGEGGEKGDLVSLLRAGGGVVVVRCVVGVFGGGSGSVCMLWPGTV